MSLNVTLHKNSLLVLQYVFHKYKIRKLVNNSFVKPRTMKADDDLTNFVSNNIIVNKHNNTFWQQ